MAAALPDQPKHSMKVARQRTAPVVLASDAWAELAMYEAFFGLTEQPFALTANPRFAFYSEQYGIAEEALHYAVARKEGLMLVTGASGTGKTMLCRDLVEKLTADRHRVVLISNPFLSGLEMLQVLVAEFGLGDATTSSRKELLDRLKVFLLEQLAGGRTCIAIFDEAQHLSTEFLEQIRVLSNLETDREKLIQIVLVGQPELLALLRMPQMAQLDQRVSVRCTLTQLSCEETTRYIDHRLNVAGAHGRVRFLDKGVRRLYQATGGVPRLINLTCDRALLSGFADQATEIGDAQIRQGIASLHGEGGVEALAARSSDSLRTSSGRLLSWIIGCVAAVAALAAALAFFWFGLDGGAEVLAWQGAVASSARDAEQAYVRIAGQHRGSRQREQALLRLAQLQIAKGDGREAVRWLNALHRDYPAGVQDGERQYWMVRALLTRGDTLGACSVTRDVRPEAAENTAWAYSGIYRECDAFEQRARVSDSVHVANGNVVDTLAVVVPAGVSLPRRGNSLP